MKFPKPVKREKKRKPLRRGRSLTPATYAEARATMLALRARARRRRQRLVLNPRAAELVKRGTKHSRRVREWGRMAFAHTWPCDVVDAWRDEFAPINGGLPNHDVLTIEGPTPCRGRRQYMHLHLVDDGGVRPPDHQGAIGCESHHDDIDGRSGRRARAWFIALGDGQLRLKRRLVERQRARWERLNPEQQAVWDETAAARRRDPRSIGA